MNFPLAKKCRFTHETQILRQVTWCWFFIFILVLKSDWWDETWTSSALNSVETLYFAENSCSSLLLQDSTDGVVAVCEFVQSSITAREIRKASITISRKRVDIHKSYTLLCTRLHCLHSSLLLRRCVHGSLEACRLALGVLGVNLKMMRFIRHGSAFCLSFKNCKRSCSSCSNPIRVFLENDSP